MKFDLDRYLTLVGRLDEDGIDYGAFRRDPLDPASLRCLRYMHDVEHHTTCYLRDLLVTSAHADPDITTFLAMWSFEEHWHGAAIAKVLDAHDEPSGRARITATRRALGHDRLRTLSTMAVSAATEHMTTIALTWGAVNEWTTQAGYVRLASVAGHPVLDDLLRRIARQEGRHIDFYASQAERRLGASNGARRATRFALAHRWRPVGSGLMPPAETAHLVSHLFGGDEGRAMTERIDRRIARLPGLEGLTIVMDARDKAVQTCAA
jgi:hypothetical protein